MAESRWFSSTVRDPRWSDALAVVSLVAALAAAAGGAALLTWRGTTLVGVGALVLIAVVLAIVAVGCLRTAVSRRVLVLLAIPVIPYAILGQEKLASDLVGPFGHPR